MATLSLREITESQLSDTPIADGQLICCLDTGRFYRDTASTRVSLGTEMVCVTSLPLAPITDKIYLVKPNSLYVYDGDNWITLNETPVFVVTEDTVDSFPTTGSEDCIYIARADNKIYRYDETDNTYYCIGTDYDDIEIVDGGSALE